MVAIDKYTLKQLKGLARKRGLSTKGKRGDLIKRLRPRKTGRHAQPRIPMHYYSEELNTLKIGRGKPLIRQRRIAIIPKDLQMEERKNAVRHLINNQTAQLVNLREQGKLTQDQLGTAIDKINDLHNIESERRQKRTASAKKGAETRRRARVVESQRRQLELVEQKARDKSRELESDVDIEIPQEAEKAKRFAMRQRAEERKRAFKKNRALMSLGDSESDSFAARAEFMDSLLEERKKHDFRPGEMLAQLRAKMAEDDARSEPKPKRADSGMASGTEGRDKQRVRRRMKQIPGSLREAVGGRPVVVVEEGGERVPLALNMGDSEDTKVAPFAEAMASTGDPNV